MKKVITLLLAAGLVIGAASAANAVDIKAKGLCTMPCPSRTVILKNTTAPTRCRMPPVSVRRSTSSRRKASRVSSILKSDPELGQGRGRRVPRH